MRLNQSLQLASVWLSLFVILFVKPVQAQPTISCPSVNVGNDTIIQGPGCPTLTASLVSGFLPTTYTAQAIPYNPYPYNVGTPILLNVDDTYSAALNIGFDFCFYGNTYTQCVIGSNGILTFDLTRANGFGPWAINNPIPSALNPTNSIMAPWQDIDPSVGGTIRWATYGVAPCRTFVVSWEAIPMYSNACNNRLHTSQIVIYETTNIIETYILNKPQCNNWNGGQAIHGIQNEFGTMATVVPGRNAGVQWAATNDGWRFLPAGAPNYTINWYEVGNPVPIGNTVSISPCPTSCSTDYYAEVTFTNCNSTTLNISDTMNVTINPQIVPNPTVVNVSCGGGNDGSITLAPTGGAAPYSYLWTPGGATTNAITNLTAGNYSVVITDDFGCIGNAAFVITEPTPITANTNLVMASCNGGNDGSITVTNTAGGTAPYQYSLNGGPFQASNVFNGLAAGTYTVVVRDANNCTLTLANLVITEPAPITANTTLVMASCNGGNDGSITVSNVMGGAAPFQYSLNGGPFQASNVFNGLAAGTYTVVVRDANNCTLTLTNLVITEPAPITANTNLVMVSCNGGNDGSITVTNTAGGTAPYQYSLNGGPFQASNVFNGLTAGTYTVTVRDANNCTLAITNLNITEPPAITANTVLVMTSCNGGNDGSITVTNAAGGTAPYQYSLNGGPFQASNVFPGLTAGTYTVTVRDANNCTLALTNLVITEPAAITANTVLVMASCNGGNDGSITVTNTAGGTAPYQYSLNGGPFQASNVFPGLTAGTYTVTVRDANNCTLALTNLVITEPATITANTNLVMVTCNGANDGSITVTNTAGGTAPYQYSLNGGPFQASNVFNGLAPGTYTVTVRDANNCTLALTNLVITEPAAITAATALVMVSCNGGNDGSITVNNTAGGTAPYQYSLNGGPFQASNVFNGLTAGTYTVTVRDANNCTLALTNLVITEPAAITATTTLVMVTCNGANDGSITVNNAAGGTAPYQYSLNGGPFQASNVFNSLAPGTYTVTVRDANNCTLALTNLVITEPALITANTTLVMVSCNGANDGSITVTNTAGGTAPYQYSLNGGPFQASNVFNGLAPGAYNVIVRDANNCTLAINGLLITEPTVITANDSTVTATCLPGMDGEIWINNAMGGTPPYQYNLNGGAFQVANNFTGLNGGTYTVVVQDANGCTFTLNPTVPTPGNVMATATPTDASCPGASDGQIVANATAGNAPFQYSLNAGPFQVSATFPGLTAGSYTLTVRDALGCTTTLNVNVGEPAAITATPVIALTSCNGAADGSIDMTNVAGGTAPYQFSLNGGPFQAGTTFGGLAAGTYTVTVRDANNCTQAFANLVVGEPAPITAGTNLTMVTCNGAADGMIDVINAAGGTPPYQYSLNGGPFQAGNSFTGLAPGAYSVVVRDANNCTLTINGLNITEPAAITANDSTVTATCIPGMDGEIWINNAMGGTPPYQYSLNGGPLQAANNFTGLNSGAYTVVVQDANGCTFTLNPNVPSPGNVTATATPADASCAGATDGQISVNATAGVGPFQYSLNGGPFQAGNTFTGLGAAAYTVTVRDALGCTTTVPVNVGEPAVITATPVVTTASCNAGADGSIDMTNVAGGTAPYQYSLNGGPFQAATTFGGLTAGTYTVTVRDANNCTQAFANLVVGEPAAITAGTNLTMVTCNGAADGVIDVINAAGGTPPYQYSLNGGPFQAGNSFTGLAPGAYSVVVRDANNCTLTINGLNISEPTAITANDSTVTATCIPGMDGEIWINNAAGGTPPYQYNLNGGPFQAANNFGGLNGGAYTVVVQDANGCTFTLNPNVPSPGNVTATATPADASCPGGNDGQISVNPTTGNAPFQYNINGGPFQVGNTFTGLTAASYTITVRDAAGCSTTLNVNVGEPAAITATPVITPASCNGGTDGSIDMTNAAGGTAPYQYSLNGGPFQAGSTFGGLAAGTYTVTVRDANNCTQAFANLVVGEPAAITAGTNLTNVSCNAGMDGVIDVINAAGGTPPYQYSLNGGAFQAGNSFTGLAAGMYNITVRDANNCTLTINGLMLTEPAPVTATDSTVTATCNPGMDGEIWILNVAGGTPPYQYSLNAGPFQAANNFGGLNGGAYTVVVQDANGCTFTLNPNVPSPGNVTATDSLVQVTCPGGADGEIWITASSANPPLQYSLNGGPLQAANNFTGLTAGNYTVDVRDALGCTVALNVSITEPAPISGTAVATDVICNGANDGTMEAQNVMGGTPPYQYSLNGGPFQAGALFTNLAPGGYTITIQDANGCIDSLAVQQVQEPGALSASDSTVTASCNPGMDGEVWILNAAGGIPPYQYSLGAGPFQAANSFTGLNGGNYVVRVQDANLCVITLNVVVPSPANIAAMDSLVHVTCPGGMDGEIWVTNVMGNAPFQYSLNGAAPVAQSSFTGLSAGNYTIDVIDSLGCQVTLNVSLTEPQIITAAATTVNVTCNGAGDGELTVVGTMGGTPPYQYSLNSGPFQTSNVFTGLTPGMYSFEVQDSNGCSIVVGPVNITEPQPLAYTDSTAHVSCNGGMDGTWFLTGAMGGTPPYEISQDSLTWLSQTSFAGLAAGAYTFYLRDSMGCALSISATVTEPTALALSTGTTPSTCGNADGAAFVTATGGTPGYSYLWSSGATTDTANGLASGVYSVTVTDANGCEDSIQVTVVDLLAPTAAIAVSGDVSCFGGTDGFAVASASGGSGTYSYSWNLPTPVNSDSLTNVPAGTYLVTVQDSAGCSDTISVVIGEPMPLSLAGSATDPVCPGNEDGSATVVATGGTPAYDYLWSTMPAQTGATANLLAAGSHSVTVTDANGCTDSLSFTLTDPVQVTAAFTANPPMPTQLELEDASIVFSNQSQNAAFYQWAFGDGNTDSLENPLHTYTEVGTYCVSLVASDSAGCTDTSEVCNYTIVLTEFVIPNTMTPNGDGRNDVFEILGISQFPNNKLQVFNRWGNIVYEKDKYDNTWDGTNWKNGAPLPDGAYFYIFTTGVEESDEKPAEVMGDIVIFR